MTLIRYSAERQRRQHQIKCFGGLWAIAFSFSINEDYNDYKELMQKSNYTRNAQTIKILKL